MTVEYNVDAMETVRTDLLDPETEIDDSVDRAGQRYKKRNKYLGRILCFVSAAVVVAIIIAIIVYATITFKDSLVDAHQNVTASNSTNATMGQPGHTHFLHY